MDGQKKTTLRLQEVTEPNSGYDYECKSKMSINI